MNRIATLALSIVLMISAVIPAFAQSVSLDGLTPGEINDLINALTPPQQDAFFNAVDETDNALIADALDRALIERLATLPGFVTWAQESDIAVQIPVLAKIGNDPDVLERFGVTVDEAVEIVMDVDAVVALYEDDPATLAEVLLEIDDPELTESYLTALDAENLADYLDEFENDVVLDVLEDVESVEIFESLVVDLEVADETYEILLADIATVEAELAEAGDVDGDLLDDLAVLEDDLEMLIDDTTALEDEINAFEDQADIEAEDGAFDEDM
ncbi:MAG: hypothetical protein AAF125_27050, partial [Chloroflexota bacterium]